MMLADNRKTEHDFSLCLLLDARSSAERQELNAREETKKINRYFGLYCHILLSNVCLSICLARAG